MGYNILEELIESKREVVLARHGKTEEDLQGYIEHIKEWLKKQPHLPYQENEWQANKLIRLIVNRKYSMERTKQTIDLHFTVRNLIPEVFDNWDVSSPQIQRALTSYVFLPLRKLTPNLQQVSIWRFIDPDVEKYSPWESTKLALLIGTLRAQVEFADGEQTIFDLKGFTMAHILKLNPTVLKKQSIAVRNANGIRLAGIHYLNVPPQFEFLLSSIRAITPPKIFSRFQYHKNLESLHKCIPREILPKDYGGDEPPYEELFDKWKQALAFNRENLLEDIKLRADESKRVGMMKDDIFGSIHGSFRQLNVD